MTRAEALRLVFKLAGMDVEPAALDRDKVLLRRAVRAAWERSHPDRNEGATTLFDQLEQAAQVLGLVR